MAGPSDEKKALAPPRPAFPLRVFFVFLIVRNFTQNIRGHFVAKARADHGGHKLFAAFSLRQKLFDGARANFFFVKFLKKTVNGFFCRFLADSARGKFGQKAGPAFKMADAAGVEPGAGES